MHLLDTNVAMHVRDRTSGIKGRIASLGVRPKLSLLTWVELEGGVPKFGELSLDRRRSIDALLQSFDFLPCDAPVVRAYARIIAAAGFSRRRIIDRLIAATAIVHDLTLVTMNEADFRDVPDLKFEVWVGQ
jgi:tRNA(fMet)-specific endonuclease VapC